MSNTTLICSTLLTCDESWFKKRDKIQDSNILKQLETFDGNLPREKGRITVLKVIHSEKVLQQLVAFVTLESCDRVNCDMFGTC